MRYNVVSIDPDSMRVSIVASSLTLNAAEDRIMREMEMHWTDETGFAVVQHETYRQGDQWVDAVTDDE